MKTLRDWIKEAQALHEQKLAREALVQLRRSAVEEQVTAGLYDLILHALGLEIAENAVIKPEFYCTHNGDWVFQRASVTFGFRLTTSEYLVSVSVACKGNEWTNDPSCFLILHYKCSEPHYTEQDFVALLLALIEHDAAQVTKEVQQ